MTRELDLSESDMERVSLMMDKPLLEAIAKAAEKYGMTRSAFIRQACVHALEEGANGPDWEALVDSTMGPFYYDLKLLKARIGQIGYVSPEGWAIVKKKITDKKGPVESLMNLQSPYDQLLRLLELSPKVVEADIKNHRPTKLGGGG